MVSNTRDDFPEPETPVKTVIFRRGMSTEMFRRLFSRAPRTWIAPKRSDSGDDGDILLAALFKAEARLSQDDFISVPQGDAFAQALWDGDHGAIPEDCGSMGASIIEEPEHCLLGIELKVGMSPRDGWVWRLRIVAECNVISSCEPPIRIDDFHQTSQVNALLLQAELLLPGSSGDDGKPDLHCLFRWLWGGNAAVVHIEGAGRYIGRQFRHQFHLYREPRWQFYALILEPKVDVPRESICFDEDEFVRASQRWVRQKNTHLQLCIGKHLLATHEPVSMSSDVVEQGSMNLQQFAFLVW